MRITILATGQIKASEESRLFDTYHQRAVTSGRHIGISAIDVIENKGRKGTSGEQRAREDSADIQKIMDKIQSDDPACQFILLDERGDHISSQDFAKRLETWQSHSHICFVLGGADGFDDAMRQRARALISLGKMSWPHLLARVLLMEQIWRGISILTHHPYHRD